MLSPSSSGALFPGRAHIGSQVETTVHCSLWCDPMAGRTPPTAVWFSCLRTCMHLPSTAVGYTCTHRPPRRMNQRQTGARAARIGAAARRQHRDVPRIRLSGIIPTRASLSDSKPTPPNWSPNSNPREAHPRSISRRLSGRWGSTPRKRRRIPAANVPRGAP